MKSPLRRPGLVREFYCRGLFVDRFFGRPTSRQLTTPSEKLAELRVHSAHVPVPVISGTRRVTHFTLQTYCFEPVVLLFGFGEQFRF